MNVEAVLDFTDLVIFTHTGKHLSDLQSTILRQVWQGKKYLDIAETYGCTEGHVKDIAYLLWKLLSEILGERVTKINFRTVLERKLQSKTVATSVPNSISESPNFIGRENAIAHLNTLMHQGHKIIIIQGEGGIGKTTLAQQYLNRKDFELVLELLMAKESQNITTAETVVEEWLRKDFNEEPGREFGVTLGRFKRHLENRKIGILIDNLEPALDKYGKLLKLHHRYGELLRVLADVRVQSVTLITSRDRLCESDINTVHYRLPGLDNQAWQKFFDFRQIQRDDETLKMLHKTYGGNAKAMGIICGVIQQDFASNINAYWQEYQDDPLLETDLKNLVTSQFERLKSLDIEAYQLLCRLGCYRYQDISTIPKSGLLSLLWDIEASQQKRIIESLRNRSLIEFYQGNYWLHPIIRTEAIARLRISEGWEIINCKAAEFWTDSVKKIETIQDALTALEAYYHYVEIKDYEQAGQVILKSRNNQWRQFLPLGSTLYRMGLLQPVLSAITQVIDRIQSPYNLSELYNILGDLYWITGKIDRAIICQEKTIAIVTQCLKQLESICENQHNIYYLRMLNVDSLLSIGLYKIDLWELQAAANLFKQVIELTSNTAHYRWGQKASVCLALVNSYLGFKKAASDVADTLYEAILSEQFLEYTGRFAYFIQILGQTYVNLGEIEKAFNLYQRAIAFSNESNYTQVKAKSLTGLAEIYRHHKQFELAFSHHLESIKLLEKISAKCDLAEAYFQLGLTYKKLEEVEQSKINFERAIQLFTEMKAQKQVTKVLTISQLIN